jgi:hypothetical protein
MVHLKALWGADHDSLAEGLGSANTIKQTGLHIFNMRFKRLLSGLRQIRKDISPDGQKTLDEIKESYENIAVNYQKYQRKKRTIIGLDRIKSRMKKLLQRETNKIKKQK